MVARNVERVEVIVVRLGFGTDDDGEAVPREVRAALRDDPAHRMDRTESGRSCGKRHVDRRRQLLVEGARLEAGAPLRQAALHHGDRVVDRLTRAPAFLRRERADRAANLGDFAVSSEVCNAHVFERLFVGRRLCRAVEALLQPAKLVR